MSEDTRMSTALLAIDDLAGVALSAFLHNTPAGDLGPPLMGNNAWCRVVIAFVGALPAGDPIAALARASNHLVPGWVLHRAAFPNNDREGYYLERAGWDAAAEAVAERLSALLGPDEAS